MEELKPCPFCGGAAEISHGRFDGKDTSYVMCRKCGAQGEFFFVSPKYASNERAIEAWNRRTSDALQVREKLLDVLSSFGSDLPCDEAPDPDWCAENCDWREPQHECWLRWARRIVENDK